EILIGVEQYAIHVKTSDTLDIVNRCNLPLVVGLNKSLGGNFRSIFNDLHHLAGGVKDRIIGGLQPNGRAVFAFAAIGANAVLALLEVIPKFGKTGAMGMGRFYKY